jgi:hypothetical protein
MWKGLTGFSTSEALNKTKVQQDWISPNYQHLGLDIPNLKEFQHHECLCKRFAIDALGDHLQLPHATRQSHAGRTRAHHRPAAAVQQGGTQNCTETRANQPWNEGG